MFEGIMKFETKYIVTLVTPITLPVSIPPTLLKS